MAAKQIALKQDTTVYEGYVGRGRSSRRTTIKAGTLVNYSALTLNNGDVVHTVSKVINGVQYRASRTVHRQERAAMSIQYATFNGETNWIIERGAAVIGVVFRDGDEYVASGAGCDAACGQTVAEAVVALLERTAWPVDQWPVEAQRVRQQQQQQAQADALDALWDWQ